MSDREQVANRLSVIHDMLHSAMKGGAEYIDLDWFDGVMFGDFFKDGNKIERFTFEVSHFESGEIWSLIYRNIRHNNSARSPLDVSAIGWPNPIEIEQYDIDQQPVLRFWLSKPDAT